MKALPIRIISFFLMLLLISACASTGTQRLGKLSPAEANKIAVNGKTTKAQLRQALGEPNDIDFNANGQTNAGLSA